MFYGLNISIIPALRLTTQKAQTHRQRLQGSPQTTIPQGNIATKYLKLKYYEKGLFYYYYSIIVLATIAIRIEKEEEEEVELLLYQKC